MKFHCKRLSVWAVSALLMAACTNSGEETGKSETTVYEFDISLEMMQDKVNAPALQSFAHAVYGSKWLLFGGRTNREAFDGGLHMINGDSSDYSVTSFPPQSFNTDIMVYDVEQDKVLASVSIYDFLTYLETAMSGQKDAEKLTGYIPGIKEAVTSLRATNPLVTQEGEYLYIIGGYGTNLDSTNSGNNYQTFDRVIRLHVPSMINLLTMQKVDNWDNFFRFGSDSRLQSTGGEVHMIENTLYLCGGHNFGKGANNGQQYVDAVFPFTVADNPDTIYKLQIKVGSPITDVPDSLGTTWADNNSVFRRRDGPIVPILVENSAQPGTYAEGIAFYGGVFQPGEDLKAWNDAIYVTPDFSGKNMQLTKYTVDKNYNQNNYNVYSCPDFAVAATGADNVRRLHTFLPGGIGNGHNDGNLSAFTDSEVETVLNSRTMLSEPLTDTAGIFGHTSYYFGAEAAFIPVSDSTVQYLSVTTGATPFIDADKTFNNGTVSSVHVGYIYGGIVAFQKSPGKASDHGFGPGYSGASNAIWKVTLQAIPVAKDKKKA